MSDDEWWHGDALPYGDDTPSWQLLQFTDQYDVDDVPSEVVEEMARKSAVVVECSCGEVFFGRMIGGHNNRLECPECDESVTVTG